MNEKRNFDYKRLHPFKWYILENFPFLEDSIDVLTNYQLFCKLGEMYNKEVDAINTLGIQVEGLTDWFDNLDVQDEINNKLDEMAESGELEEIISEYINANAIIGFDTLADLKNADNLIDGSYAKTLGYYTKNDGGSATYKIRTITNDDVVDNMFIVAMNNNNTLIAELIIETPINPKQLGAYGDGVHDDLLPIQTAINLYNVQLKKANYYVSDPINIPEFRIFDGNGATLISAENKYAIEIIGLPNTPVRQVNVQNVIIDTTTNGGNGIDLEYGYFIYLDNINIFNLSKNGAIGINQVNGFNTTITNSRVLGDRTYSNTYGIKITTTSGGTANMTNNKYDTILLQRLTYGVNANFTTSSNVNEFNNIGFSDNNYGFYISGYADPISFTNTRMEDNVNVTDSTGFYITGSINSLITNLNAYNVKRVIDNNGSSDKRMNITGAVSLTGTNQNPKLLFLYHTTQNILYSCTDYIIGSTYQFDSGTTYDGGVLVNSNGFLPYSSTITTGTISTSLNQHFIYKVSTANITNIFGRINTECYLYTEESGLKIVGKSSSATHQGAELTLTPYRLYHVKFYDNSKFIVSE